MDDVLIHYGVLGMKWGVRRYQNKDGSLTSAGKKRYSGDSDSSSGVSDAKRRSANFAKAAKQASNVTSAVANSVKSSKNSDSTKKMKDMSDDDLMKANKRDALEAQYKKNRGIEKGSQSSSVYDRVDKAMQGVSEAANNIQKKYERAADSETARKAKRMSEDELRKAVNRMNLERQYRDLSKADRESGANYVYDRRKETIDDIISVTMPLVTSIVAPIIVGKILKS